MEDWYISQKIVCINVDAFPPNQHPPTEVTKYLRVGKVYEIEEIGIFKYDLEGERVAFKLKGITCDYKVYVTNHKDDIVKTYKEYMFWSGRFRPLDEMENLEKLIKSVDNWVDPLDDKENFEEEQFKKLKPVRRKEKVKIPEPVEI